MATYYIINGVQKVSSVGGLFVGLSISIPAYDIDEDNILAYSDPAITSSIGVSVQAYDADTAKLDVAQVWPTIAAVESISIEFGS